MKICPNCKKEYSDDVVFCLEDGTALETSDKASEAETINLPADAVPPTMAFNEADTAAAEDEKETVSKEAETSEAVEAPATAEVSAASETTEKVEDKPVTVSTAAAANRGGMSAAAKGLLVVFVILAIGAGLVVWKVRAGAHGSSSAITKLTNEDIALLLKDENPMALKQLSENPETKKRVVENLRQTLAMAAQAQKEGLTKDPEVKEELEAIRTEITAVTYDKKKNADKGPMPPFGFIGEDQVKAYYAEPGNEAKFKTFIDKKIEQAKKDGRLPKDREPTEEQLASARDFYAKARIYEREAKEKQAELGPEYNRKVELQVKLQQAQYLAKLYADKVLKDKIKVTEADIQEYLKQHPEHANKKAKAEEILNRARNGEDFAALAKEFSEDPGSKDKGGLYENVRKGQFVPEFEAAALALEPGQIAPQLVETKYGYHIIKLEKKGSTKDAGGQETPTFDARHILISTMITDPESPMSPGRTIEEVVQEEKEKKLMEELVAKNHIEIPEDFAVPEPSAEQLEEMKKQQEMQQQMMMEQLQKQQPNANTKQEPKDKNEKKPEAKKK